MGLSPPHSVINVGDGKQKWLTLLLLIATHRPAHIQHEYTTSLIQVGDVMPVKSLPAVGDCYRDYVGFEPNYQVFHSACKRGPHCHESDLYLDETRARCFVPACSPHQEPRPQALGKASMGTRTTVPGCTPEVWEHGHTPKFPDCPVCVQEHGSVVKHFSSTLPIACILVNDTSWWLV